MGTTVTDALSSASRNNSTGSSDKSSMSATDFLDLFVTQLQNQDFNDPMDSGQMMNQITQLSNMQMMQNMETYSKTSYAVSMIGKTVSAFRHKNGKIEKTTGTVSKVALDDDDNYVMYIGGKEYSLESITAFQEGSGVLNVSDYSLSSSTVTNNSATVKWSAPTEDDDVASGLRYTVFYSTKGPFNTVSDVESGTQFGASNQKDLLGATVTDLDAGQTYYINVLVKDADGKKYIYTPATVTTLKS